MKNSPTALGTFDAFKNAESWDSETARMWVAALNLRATAADQIALRKRLVQISKFKPRAIRRLKLAAGTGALLCDLAQRRRRRRKRSRHRAANNFGGSGDGRDLKPKILQQS